MTPERLREIRAMLEVAGDFEYEQVPEDGVTVEHYMADIPGWENDVVPWPRAQLMLQAHMIIRELLEFAERETEPELIQIIRRYIADAQFRQELDEAIAQRPGQ